MKRAQKRSAVTCEKFWFCKDGHPARVPPPSTSNSLPVGRSGMPVNGHKTVSSMDSKLISTESSSVKYEEMTIDEIINGKVRPLYLLVCLTGEN